RRSRGPIPLGWWPQTGLDAERSLFDAELGLSEARLEQLVAAVQLYKAVGGSLDGEALALRAHSARFRSLRQQPFGEVQALLRLAPLLPQLAHLGFEGFEPSLETAPAGTLELAPARTRPQALGEKSEPQRQPRLLPG